MVERKPVGTRQDERPSRAPASVTDISGGRRLLARNYPPKPSWLKEVKEQWDVYWTTQVSELLAPHHVPALYRLFELRDAQGRALRIYKREPMVQGSMKQPVVNPAMTTVQSLEKDIRALEDRLGLTPKAQASLGIKIGQAGLTAAELNRMAAEESDDDDDVAEPTQRGGADEDVSADVVSGEFSWHQA